MFETCLYYSSAKCTCVVLIRVLHTFPEFNPIYHGTRSVRAWKFQISSDQITFPRELPIFCMIAQKETTVYRELLVEWMFRLLRVATKKIDSESLSWKRISYFKDHFFCFKYIFNNLHCDVWWQAIFAINQHWSH